MFDINKRKCIGVITIRELIEELKQLPQDAGFCCCGAPYAYIHVNEDGSGVCIDTESLDGCYDFEEEQDD